MTHFVIRDEQQEPTVEVWLEPWRVHGCAVGLVARANSYTTVLIAGIREDGTLRLGRSAHQVPGLQTDSSGRIKLAEDE